MTATLLMATPYQWMQLLGTRLSSDPYSGFLGRAVDLGAGLTVADGRRIVRRLLRRHAALRVRFVDQDGRILQMVRPVTDLPASLAAPAPVPGGPVRDVHRLTLQEVFPAAPDPFGDEPAQVRLAVDDAGHLWLCLLVHHAQVDAHSVAVLMASAAREAGQVAALRDAGQEAAAEAATEAAYAAANAALLERSGTEADGGAEFWRESYGCHSRFATLAASAGSASPGSASARRGPAAAALSADDVRAVTDAGRRLNATPTMLAHTALVALAHRYAPDAVLPVGVPMSLRDLDGVGFDTMGLYINVLPAVVRVPEGGTVGSLVAAVRSRLIELQAYKFLPLWRTVELSGLRRSDLIHRNTSMFGVTLAVHSRGSGGEAGGALTSQAPPVPGMHLDIALGEAGGTARLAWRQDSPPLRDPDVLLADYLALFRHMAGDPSAAIASLPLPSDRAAVGDLADPVVVLDAVLGAFQQVTEEVPDAARSFFDSGGNSMTVARLVAVLRRKAMRVKVRDVFEHPVPSDLAAVVARRHGAEGAG